MTTFLEHFLRFVEPVLSGGAALLIVLWAWHSFDPRAVRSCSLKLIRKGNASPACVILAFLIATILGFISEEASLNILEHHGHEGIIAAAYNESPTKFGITSICNARANLGVDCSRSIIGTERDYYGAIHLFPTSDKEGKPLDGLTASRTYFANNIVRSVALSAFVGMIAHAVALLVFALKKPDVPPVGSSIGERRASLCRRLLAIAAQLVLCGGAVWACQGSEEAYHRSIRNAVVATVLIRPELCDRLPRTPAPDRCNQKASPSP